MKSQVFNQKLGENSKSVYTQVLDEDEENEVVKKIIASPQSVEWKDFFLEYLKHYAPFKSSVKLLSEGLDNVSCRETMLNIIRRYSLMDDEFACLCSAVKQNLHDGETKGAKTSEWLYLLVIFCKFSKKYSDEVFQKLVQIDDLTAKSARLEETYLKHFNA